MPDTDPVARIRAAADLWEAANPLAVSARLLAGHLRDVADRHRVWHAYPVPYCAQDNRVWPCPDIASVLPLVEHIESTLGSGS